jgi:ubiquitin C-terminal hydrolase
MAIWSVPEVLVVHLKRFAYEATSFYAYRDKLSNLVTFPIDELDITSNVQGVSGERIVYELFAVSEHMGGLGGGHYTAVAKNFKNGKWYNFNDSYAGETDAEKAVSTAAYVLFYRRKRV